MKLTKRSITLGSCLLATLLAVYFSPSAEGNDVALSEHSRGMVDTKKSETTTSKLTARPSKNAHAVLSIRSRELDEDEESVVFLSTGWASVALMNKPEESSISSKIAAVTPQAPPLPFHVLGRYVENGKIAVFLQHNDQNLVVRVGDTIADQYRVESLNGGTLTLRYIPLNVQQTLEIGGAT